MTLDLILAAGEIALAWAATRRCRPLSRRKPFSKPSSSVLHEAGIERIAVSVRLCHHAEEIQKTVKLDLPSP